MLKLILNSVNRTDRNIRHLFSRQVLGTNEKLVVDFNNRKFYFTIGRDFKNSNPEIFDFSQPQDFWLELGYTTLQDSDRDGIPDEYDRYDI